MLLVQISEHVCFSYSMLDLSVACVACEPCIHVCLLIVATIFPAIDSNEECAEEGEVFEYQEEGDQGQANQGKPST
jgi:hypothetical protein